MHVNTINIFLDRHDRVEILEGAGAASCVYLSIRDRMTGHAAAICLFCYDDEHRAEILADLGALPDLRTKLEGALHVIECAIEGEQPRVGAADTARSDLTDLINIIDAGRP